ncbi:hypothetical protein H312_01343 [Anncaliia algerae PRA339]|uniref:Uncharacterized protein n=1 Tax=Anncaliia algerae PRA339 TaxID=1288291 RepID=A0A059F243_9MICR|nr:hypothetical protein H312_01343 [Anncaliia algerae PRA339]
MIYQNICLMILENLLKFFILLYSEKRKLIIFLNNLLMLESKFFKEVNTISFINILLRSFCYINFIRYLSYFFKAFNIDKILITKVKLYILAQVRTSKLIFFNFIKIKKKYRKKQIKI